jgi:anti-sigma factor RsiW
MRRLRSRPLLCREVVELVSDYLDGTLSNDLRIRMDAHLSGCDPCVEYVGQIRATVALVERVEPEQVDPATRERLIDLYRRMQKPDPPTT